MAPPTSTYRLQLTPSFGFRDAAAIVPYLASLGVGHVYLSPVLEAAAGSTHGYDVVDHGQLSAEKGGESGWHVLQSALREHGLGCVVDVVPNHMAVPAPESANPALWSVLRDGEKAAEARWFDVDWVAGAGTLVLPVLGADLDEVVARGELTRDGDVLRYHDHEFPLAPETTGLAWPDVVHAQHYTLTRWSDRSTPLNYRRFFDITDLIALRVEDPEVFDATHRLLLDLVERGDIQGLRIDHPDGLADPRGYLRRLRATAPDAWIVAEKILAPGETLPRDWPCDGTTGYDTLRIVDTSFVDPFGVRSLTVTHRDRTGEQRTFPDVVAESKHQVLSDILRPERDRLAALAAYLLPTFDATEVTAALDELLVAMPVYRTYLVAGEPAGADDIAVVEQARVTAETRVPALAATLQALADVVLGRSVAESAAEADLLVVRFQQLASALTAKGVEDTAGYRWHVLASLCEVGGEPDHLDVLSPQDFHGTFADASPTAMTTLSTHDTKRSEDVRARLAVLSELPAEWRAAVDSWEASHPPPVQLDGAARYLVWQTLVGTWPITADRLLPYLEKAAREAKRSTSWLVPDTTYETALREYASAALEEPEVASFVDTLRRPWITNLLGAKLVQLTVPGVPDCYQGTESPYLALVDPDNRRPVDYGHLGGLLARLDTATAPPDPYADPDAAKMFVTSRALRLRRTRPDVFSTYQPVRAHGPAADHLLGFSRGGAVTLATRLPVGLDRAGGWRDTTVTFPAGEWTDLFGAGTYSGTVAVTDLLRTYPVALLTRTD